MSTHTFKRAELISLPNFPTPLYLSAGTAPRYAHELARRGSTTDAQVTLRLAGAIYVYAQRSGWHGELDYTLSIIVHNLLESFVALLDYERGGWDAGTCDSWARSVGEYIGQPLD